MAGYYIALSLHILGATIWAGGHLVLALTILPDALRKNRAVIVSEFERRFERIGLPALAVQIITGLWLTERLLGSSANWFDADARTVQVKLGLLAVTVGLAIHARLRVIPKLTDTTLPTLAWHIRIVTAAAVLVVLAGASIRFGGYLVFEQ